MCSKTGLTDWTQKWSWFPKVRCASYRLEGPRSNSRNRAKKLMKHSGSKERIFHASRAGLGTRGVSIAPVSLWEGVAGEG